MSSKAASSGDARLEPASRDAAARGPDAPSSITGFVRAYAWPIVVVSAMAGWSIAVYAIARDHFVSFRLARFDLGNMVQAVWSTTQGRPLEITDAMGEQIVRLGSHVDPVLALLAPLWLLAPTPLVLVAAQITAVSLGALPLFLLARRHTGSECAAGLLALAYLAYPWTAWTALDAFHPVTLGIPLLLFCVWFLDSDRLALFAVSAMLVMTTGELAGLFVASLGVWYALARAHRAAGLVIAAAGTAWTIVALEFVVPAFSEDSSRFYGFYEEVGGSPLGIVKTTLTDPLTLFAAVTEGRDILYVLLLAAPIAGAFVLAPWLAAVAAPQLAANVLADVSSTTDPHAHYVAGIIPFLFAATAVGLGHLAHGSRARAAGVVLTLSVAATVMAGPWPGSVVGTPTFFQTDASPEKLAALEAAVDLVPDDAPVTATNRIGSRLSSRRYVYSVPVVGRAEWIVLDSSDTWVPARAGGGWNPQVVRDFQARIEGSREWWRVFDEDGVLVFRKVRE